MALTEQLLLDVSASAWWKDVLFYGTSSAPSISIFVACCMGVAVLPAGTANSVKVSVRLGQRVRVSF